MNRANFNLLSAQIRNMHSMSSLALAETADGVSVADRGPEVNQKRALHTYVVGI